MTRLSSIFATGMVSVQRTNYTLCMGFLEGLSAVCGEEKRPHVRRRLLAQDTVAEFKARWNLPIYFQLRWGGVVSRWILVAVWSLLAGHRAVPREQRSLEQASRGL